MSALGSAGAVLGCKVSADIARLQAEQKRVREERKRVAAELRNAQKRKQRLKHRARLLSNEDLMMVAAMRETDAVARRGPFAGEPTGRSLSPEPVAGDVAKVPRLEEADANVSDPEGRNFQE